MKSATGIVHNNTKKRTHGKTFKSRRNLIINFNLKTMSATKKIGGQDAKDRIKVFSLPWHVGHQ